MKRPARLTVMLGILAVLAALVTFDQLGLGANDAIATAITQRKPPLVVREEITPPGNSGPAIDGVLALRERTGSPQDGESALPRRGAFAQHDWTPPPPSPPPPPPPPPPQAPPLPFTFIGKQQENGEWTVFLANQDRTYTLRAGDTIEATYRVDKVQPPSLFFTYLPLKQQQQLAIGAPE